MYPSHLVLIDPLKNIALKRQQYVGEFIAGSRALQELEKEELNNTSKKQSEPTTAEQRGKKYGKDYVQGTGEEEYYSGGALQEDWPERKNQSHKNKLEGTGDIGVVHTLEERKR
ncbi:hypothetical protein Tco_1570677 [Tanacetum coccineum]